MAEISTLLLRLDGFEGPLDLLLELARAEKLDLGRISILSLVDQFMAVVAEARAVRLELAADWLVMAAWLTWLKSRLLLPAGTAEADEAVIAAETLAGRLAELRHLRAAAASLEQRAVLGRDVFARGKPEDRIEIDRSRLLLDLPGLLRAYLAARRRGGTRDHHVVQTSGFWTMQDALARLAALVGALPPGSDWLLLESALPRVGGGDETRAALAGTLLAGLELARAGTVLLRQDAPFGPIRLRPANA